MVGLGIGLGATLTIAQGARSLQRGFMLFSVLLFRFAADDQDALVIQKSPSYPVVQNIPHGRSCSYFVSETEFPALRDGCRLSDRGDGMSRIERRMEGSIAGL